MFLITEYLYKQRKKTQKSVLCYRMALEIHKEP